MRCTTCIATFGLFLGFVPAATAQNAGGSGHTGRRFDVPGAIPAGMDRGSTLNRGSAGDNADRGANPPRNANTRSSGTRPTTTPPGGGNSIVRDVMDLLNALNFGNAVPGPAPTTYRQPGTTTGGGTNSTGSGPVSGGTAATPGWNGGRYNGTTSTAPPRR